MSDPRAPLPPAGGLTGTPPIQRAIVEAPAVDPRRRFRLTLVSVIAVQIVALLLLWAVQAHFTH